ncbi:hypothetical protein GGI15_004361 [Coemansia interrupta]|uniref:Galactose oxidase n=1 Tax=Coemansia interrupta TaxID=1126814 RepID=A0A9W8H3K0_9FUNG|nr:hypothetical protein GGI15_004361 [Coemansia interrupta]
MYIFGGKTGTGNSEADYASSCISINLSTKFSTSSATWDHTCENNGPLLASHSSAINSNINMVVVFGGTVPDGTDRTSSVHLFSAEIGFWSTPSDTGFPSALIDHSAVLQDSTGDMLVFGGLIQPSGQISNSTLAMVTDTGRHGYVAAPPPIGFTNITATSVAPSRSTTSSSSKSSSTKKSSSKTTTSTKSTSTSTSTPSATVNDNDSDSEESIDDDDDGDAPSLLDSATSTKKTSTSTKSTSTKTTTSSSKSTKTSKTSKATTTSDPEDDSNARNLILRDSGDDNAGEVKLMSWTNDTLPNEVSGRTGHTATMVNDSDMVILGGSDGSRLVGLNVVYVYTASQRQWSRRTATGSIPTARQYHVATVVNSTLIVIHGGANLNLTTAMKDVAVLDTETWTWSAPQISNSPEARFAHSASQAGPYMMIAFGRTVSLPSSIASDDYGLYILDTTSWSFVTQFDPARSGLVLHYKNTSLAGATIFGLFVASVAGLCILMILFYIGCMHYYNRHPRLSEDGENTAMLPTNELRNIGRRLTEKLGTQKQRERAAARNRSLMAGNKLDSTEHLVSSNKCNTMQMYSPEPTSPELTHTKSRRLSNIPKIGDDTSMRIMFDLSRDSSLDKSFISADLTATNKRKSPRVENARLSRRTHLDNVQLPAGLRNRDDLDGGDGVLGDSDSETTAESGGNWSRPTTSHSQASRKSKHVSAMLPRVVGSRLTLPMESATALARYRFEELEDDSESANVPPIPTHIMSSTDSSNDTKLDGDASAPLPLPVMPAAQVDAALGGQRRSDSRDSTSEDKDGQSGVQAPPTLNVPLRDSIDLNTMFSSNLQFFVANPDH